MIRRLLRQTALLLAIAAVPAAISGVIQLEWRNGGVANEELLPGEIRAGTARIWGEKVLWVDARSRKRYELEHIPGAILLNEDEWERCVPEFLDAWSPDKTIVVYCDGGRCEASHAVAARLREELQLESVYVLKGGWDAWRKP